MLIGPFRKSKKRPKEPYSENRSGYDKYHHYCISRTYLQLVCYKLFDYLGDIHTKHYEDKTVKGICKKIPHMLCAFFKPFGICMPFFVLKCRYDTGNKDSHDTADLQML